MTLTAAIFFAYSPESLSFVFSASLCVASSSFDTVPVRVPQTTLYKSRSMLSIDGSFMLKFQSRQNLFSKGPWHLLKTRHLVRNSRDRELFSKTFSLVHFAPREPSFCVSCKLLPIKSRRETSVEIPRPRKNFFLTFSAVRSPFPLPIIPLMARQITPWHRPCQNDQHRLGRSPLNYS